MEQFDLFNQLERIANKSVNLTPEHGVCELFVGLKWQLNLHSQNSSNHGLLKTKKKYFKSGPKMIERYIWMKRWIKDLHSAKFEQFQTCIIKYFDKCCWQNHYDVFAGKFWNSWSVEIDKSWSLNCVSNCSWQLL